MSRRKRPANGLSNAGHKLMYWLIDGEEWAKPFVYVAAILAAIDLFMAVDLVF